MATAAHEALREENQKLKEEIAALRLGRLVGAPEGLSEVGTTETRIDVSELLDEVDQLKREKYAAIQHLDEAQRALLLADAVLRQKYPGGLKEFGSKDNIYLDQWMGAICQSMLENTPEAENFGSFSFSWDNAEEGKRRIVVTMWYADAKTTPEDVAHKLREENQKLNETNDILMKENAQLGECIQELETEVQRLRGRIAELEDDR